MAKKDLTKIDLELEEIAYIDGKEQIHPQSH